MTKPTTKIPIFDVILDEKIYPRERIDPKRNESGYLQKMSGLVLDLTRSRCNLTPRGPENIAYWMVYIDGTLIRQQGQQNRKST